MSRLFTLRRAFASFAAVAAAWVSLGLARADTRDLAAATDTCKKAADKQVVIASCSTVISLSHDPRLLERVYNRRGMANEATGQFNGAVNDYSQVIRLDPRVAGYYDNRMRAYKALGLLDQALADSNTAVGMAPGYPFVFHGRGAVHYDRGEYLQAVADYGTALAMNRADAPLLVDRGRALIKLGQPGNAVRDFSEAHEVDAAFTPALRERGLAWAQLGNADAARPDLQVALAANPSDDEAEAALRSLDTTADAPVPAQRVAQAGASPEAERAEAEARQRLKARDDAESARQEAAGRLKNERLARARTEAEKLRREAGEFVKANRDDPQLMDHLQHIADVGAALPGSEPATIERATSLLSADLASDPIYAADAERRRLDKARDDQRNLTIALSTLRVQRGFLVGEVVKDPTGDDASAFLSLAKQAGAVLEAPELVHAQTVMGAIDAAIARAKMTDRYEEAKRAAPADKSAP